MFINHIVLRWIMKKNINDIVVGNNIQTIFYCIILTLYILNLVYSCIKI